MFLLAYEYLPKTASTAAGFGRSHEILGNLGKALELYGEALEIDPANRLAGEGLARISSQ